METQISGTNETQGNQAETDPWAAAFAALEQVGTSDSEGTADTGANESVSDGDLENTNGTDQGEVHADQAQTDDSAAYEETVGGLDSSAGDGREENGNAFSDHLGISEKEIEEYETKLNESIRDRAIGEIADEFIKRGIRNNNGKLGATLDDPDICKRDEDGVPRFYNPETGREFTGDNPRRQAQEWVDDYNKELARVFNNACEQYENHLLKESEPGLAVMKFAPKYEKLDDIRRGMFDNVIEDYEVKDNAGKVIGYSCDLDKALALVDRQVAMIQSYAKNQSAANNAAAPSGPALDMKTSSGAVASGDRPAPTSLAEAMERLQDVQLENLKK